MEEPRRRYSGRMRPSDRRGTEWSKNAGKLRKGLGQSLWRARLAANCRLGLSSPPNSGLNKARSELVSTSRQDRFLQESQAKRACPDLFAAPREKWVSMSCLLPIWTYWLWSDPNLTSAHDRQRLHRIQAHFVRENSTCVIRFAARTVDPRILDGAETNRTE
jgi:hypothetical protein